MAQRISKPYALSDSAINRITKYAVRQFTQAKRTMLIDGFDELTVIKQIKVVYARLDKKNRKEFELLFFEKYKEVYKQESGEMADNDIIDELAEMALSGLLNEPNSVTGYIYSNEVTRKRDRTEEAVNAASAKQGKSAELDKALRYWGVMSAQYCDAVSDEANIQALKAAKAKYVRWNTQEDERVCDTCKGRNGKIYRIDQVPGKPHYRCRCYVTAVSKWINRESG